MPSWKSHNQLPSEAGSARLRIRHGILAGLSALLVILLAFGLSWWAQGRRERYWIQQAIALSAPDAESRDQAAQALKERAAEAIPALAAVLRRPDTAFRRPFEVTAPRMPLKMRRWIFRNLGPLDGPEERRAALRALAQLGTNVPPQILVDAFHVPERDIAFLAAETAGRRGPESVPALVQASNHPDAFIRLLACIGFTRIGPAATNAIPPLIRRLNDSDAATSDKAAEALTGLGIAAVPALIDALASPDPQLKVAALRTLSRLGYTARDALLPVAQMGTHPAPAVRRAVASALANIQAVAPASVDALTLLLADVNPTVRSAAAAALQRAGQFARPALSALQAAALDDDPSVRSNATRTLQMLRPVR